MHDHINYFEELDAEILHFNELYDTNSLISDKYFSVGEFKEISQSLRCDKKISVLHWNVRSILPKIDQTTAELQALSGDFDVLCFGETWLNDNTKDLVALSDYESFQCCRDLCCPGGSVGIFAKSSLKPKLLTRFQISLPYFESVGVEITKYNRKFLVLEIYRPPRSTPSNFLDKLETLFCNFQTTQYEEIFLCGDYNLNLLDSDSNNSVNLFLNQMSTYSLLPVISRPTRITEQSSTLIDNIFIKHPNDFDSGTIISTISPSS